MTVEIRRGSLKISIIVPSYNQGRFLEQTLRSILCQGYPNLEVLVLDGGSTDDSVAIIERYAPQLTYWRSHRDGGHAAAVAEGLNMATGDICAFVNSDDMLAPGALDAAERAFARYPEVDWIIGDTCLIDEHSRPYHYLREPYILKQWQIFVRNCIPQPSVFWRKSFYDGHAAINPNLSFCMDPDLFFQFWKSNEPMMLRRLISYQRHHASTKTATLKDVAAREYPLLLEKYFQVRASSSKLARLLWRGHRIGVKALRLYYLHGVLRWVPQARRQIGVFADGGELS